MDKKTARKGCKNREKCFPAKSESKKLPDAEESLVFPSNIYAIRPFLGPVGFQVIALTTGITAVFHVKPVAVQRAGYLAKGVYVAIGHNSAGMGAFMGKSEELAIVAGQGHHFVPGGYQAHLVLLPGYHFLIFAHFEPFPFIFVRRHVIRSAGVINY